MKKFKYSILIFMLTLFITGISLAQVEKNKLILGLGYFNDNNQQQYLKAGAKAKINGRYTPVGGIHVSFYIHSESPDHLLGKGSTDDKGQVILMMPPAAKNEWIKSPRQNFLVVSDSSNLYDGTNASFDLTKSRIKIDTTEDKKIIATLLEQKDSAWVPVKGVDMKIAVKRLGGDLNVSETPTYTTDSMGIAQADFTYRNLPGDSAGNLILVASVEDNDVYGNLTSEKTVPWGTSSKYISEYNTRSLFARRGWSPLWLVWMAYSITAGVWFILFYLFFQIRKLKKLGA
jgi:hypothetical protein